MRRPGNSSNSSSSRHWRGPELVSGTLYGGETFDPVLLLAQLLLLLSCFYLLLCAASLGSLTLLQHRQLSPSHAQQPDLLLLDDSKQQQQQQPPTVASAAAAATAAATRAAAQQVVSRRVSLLFSSGSPDTPKETAAALDAAMLLTGIFLSVCVFWVVKRSRKVVDFCCSLGLMHVLACTLFSGFPTRSGYWLSLASSGCLCGLLAFCLCRRAESEPIVFSSACRDSPSAKTHAAAAAVELQPLQRQPLQQQEEQQLLLAA
ncbi:hypothetical protein Efla_001784 [Eimeria flavescens]